MLYILATPAFILDLEILIVGTQNGDTLDKTEKRRDVGPAEDEVQNTLTTLTQIELVNAQTAKKNCQKSGNNFVLDGPVCPLGVGDSLLNVDYLLRLSLLCGLGSLGNSSTAVFTFGSTGLGRRTALRT